jgi:hypothetical protein
MVKPRRSGHGDTVKRQLTPTQKRTLKNRGQITVTIQLDGVRYHKTVRPRNIRGGAWEYYRRSDNHYEPSLRDYKRDNATHHTGGTQYRHKGRGHDRT